MNTESQPMVNELLSYLYGSFLITYFLCIVGFIIKEILSSKEDININIRRLLAFPIPITIILCFIKDKTDFSFSLYVMICVLGGICSDYIDKLLVNSKFPNVIMKAIYKSFKDPVIKALSEASLEIEKEEKKNENKDKKDEENKETESKETEIEKENDDQHD